MATRLVMTGKVAKGQSKTMALVIDNHPDAKAEEAGLIPWFPKRPDGSYPTEPSGTRSWERGRR